MGLKQAGGAMKYLFHFFLIFCALIILFAFTPTCKRWEAVRLAEIVDLALRHPKMGHILYERGSTADEIIKYLNRIGEER